MTKTEIAKTVLAVGVQYGTGLIIAGIVRSNVIPLNTVQKIGVVAGTWALSGVVANAATKYTDDLIDEAISKFQKIKAKSE